MGGLLQKAIDLIIGNPRNAERPLKRLTERGLIQLESEVGRELFGPIPAGHRREFFCLDRHTWIWFEEWVDPQTKKRQEVTTRYEIHPNGILKVQENRPYHPVEGEELKNFMLAIRMYHEKVSREVYKTDPETGKKIA